MKTRALLAAAFVLIAACPDDSDRLPEALFEAAWSMYQKRELRTARQLTAELLKSCPSAPQIPEAMLLAGYIELADCKFTEARQKFEALGKDLRPLVAAIEKARATREARRALLGRALERQERRGPSAMPLPPLGAGADDRVVAMLKLDPKLLRLDETLAALPDDRPSTKRDWQRLSRAWHATLTARIEAMTRVRDELSGCIGCGCLSLRACPVYNHDDELGAEGPGARRLPPAARA